MKYHLTENSRAMLLPGCFDNLKSELKQFAAAVEKARVLRRPTLDIWVLRLTEKTERVGRVLPRHHRRGA